MSSTTQSKPARTRFKKRANQAVPGQTVETRVGSFSNAAFDGENIFWATGTLVARRFKKSKTLHADKNCKHLSDTGSLRAYPESYAKHRIGMDITPHACNDCTSIGGEDDE